MNKIAQNIGDTLLGNSPLKTTAGIGRLVTALSSNAIVIAGVILVIMIVYAGISMISASGDPQQYERAQSILTAGIIGFIIVIAAWFIIKAIEASTGVSIL
jgi:hypothetical protein